MMGKKIIESKLPEFAVLDGSCHEGNTLEGRDVVIHIRSASVLEFSEYDDAILKKETLYAEFDFENQYNFGIIEHKMCVLHYCATLDRIKDEKMILNKIILPAIEWYKQYMRWKEENLMR